MFGRALDAAAISGAVSHTPGKVILVLAPPLLIIGISIYAICKAFGAGSHPANGDSGRPHQRESRSFLLSMFTRLWVGSIAPTLDETYRFNSVANRFHGHFQSGGRLMVSDTRLVYQPNRLGRLVGFHRVELPTREIREVRVAPAGWQSARARGLGAVVHPQVEIDTDQTRVVFAVRSIDDLLQALSDVPHA
jgi:hypothetical protein